jgi:hypothetical protein
MLQTQAKAPDAPVSGWARTLAGRCLTLVAVGCVMVWVVHQCALRFDRTREPAGFLRGLLHGALMPMSMPNLLLGQDITIYSANNQGRIYKLGYTMGVNGCGTLFFGLGFWRVSRWRRQKQISSAEGQQDTLRTA